MRAWLVSDRYASWVPLGIVSFLQIEAIPTRRADSNTP